VYGARPGRPFFYHVPATGKRPITFSAEGLPDGLKLDERTGDITGRTEQPGKHAVKITARNDQGSDTRTIDVSIGDTICLTPPMGWNSWNYFHRSIDDAKVRAAADAMAASGLIDHGWTYVNIDDCWQGTRDADGRIRGNEKFPDMKALADYVHGKGLKFGIYSSPGPRTCAGFEGSYGHEEQDAKTYADWGVDYVKYDWCSYGQVAPKETEERYAKLLPEFAAELKGLAAKRAELGGGRGPRRRQLPPEQQEQLRAIERRLQEIHSKLDEAKRKQIELEVLQEPYRQFHAALDKSGRDIVFSLCQYGMGDVWKWGPQVGGNCWRTTGDIRAAWDSIARIGFAQDGLEQWAGPGHWNDPDMLEVGNGRLTPDEMYSHFSLWCLLSAPLLIGCDMSRMNELTTSIFSNDEVIAVDQDALGRQGKRVARDGDCEVWSKPMADGSVAVGLFNRGAAAQKCGVNWSDLGIDGKRSVRDLWRQKDLGMMDAKLETEVPSQGVVLVRLAAVRH